MLSHEFSNTPGHRKFDIGDSPMEQVDLLTCKWCNRTPSRVTSDECPMHELQEVGQVLLSDFNPDGRIRFMGRRCETCERPIMGHWLRNGSKEYWCYANQNQWSYGLIPVPVGENEYWPDAAKYK